MRRLSLLVSVVLAASLAACGNKSETPPAKPGEGGAAKPADAKPADGKPAEAKPGDAKPGAGPAAGGAAKPPMALPVKAAPVKVGPFSTDVTAVGTLLPDESVLIRSEIDGRITALHFQEGQAVAKGARLVSFDASEYEAALAASSADLRTRTADHERAKDLLSKGFVSVEVVDRARGAMEVAAARVQQDQARLAKTAIFAPFSGVMGLRQISPGAYVKTGDSIVRVENIASIKLDFRVPEVYVGRIARGQPVAVSLDAFPGERFQGRIFAIEPVVDEKSRTVLARAQVPNTGGKLKPGLFARVSVQLDNRATAITIPEQAIVPQGKDTFVYKVLDGGKTQITKVQLGGRRPGEVEIVGGLAPGDVVVSEGALKLAMMPPGAPVMVLPAAGAPPAPGAAPAPGAPAAAAAGGPAAPPPAGGAAPAAKPAAGEKKGG
jgi:membrane fusion protein (multidrug efflux system)